MLLTSEMLENIGKRRIWWFVLSILLTSGSTDCQATDFPTEKLGKESNYSTLHRQLYIACDRGTIETRCSFSNVFIISKEFEYSFGRSNFPINATKTVSFFSSTLKWVPKNLLDSFPSVETLHLNHLQIENIEPTTFQQRRRIKQLNLGNNDIASLDDDVFDGIDSLEHISIEENQLSRLPSTLFQQTRKLKTITASRNNLNRIDDGTFRFTTVLETVNVSNNEITYFDLTAVPSLLDIDISCNLLEELMVPQNIIYLDASHNRIRNVAGRSNVLRVLQLSYNNLNGTSWLQLFPALVELHISHNALEDVQHEHFAPLRHLQILLLNNNRLFTANMPTSLPMLRVLNLSHNNLLYLENNANQFEKLDSLSLHHNSIVSIKLGTKNSLERISLSHNDWDCDSLRELSPLIFESATVEHDENCASPYMTVQGICCRENDGMPYLERLSEYLERASKNPMADGAFNQCSGLDFTVNGQSLPSSSANANFHDLREEVASMRSKLTEFKKLHSEIVREIHIVSNFNQIFANATSKLPEYLANTIALLKRRNQLIAFQANSHQFEADHLKSRINELEHEVIRLQANYSNRKTILNRLRQKTDATSSEY